MIDIKCSQCNNTVVLKLKDASLLENESIKKLAECPCFDCINAIEATKYGSIIGNSATSKKIPN